MRRRSSNTAPLTFPTMPEDQPCADRKGEPHQRGKHKNNDDLRVRHPEPEDQGKAGESNATEGRAHGVYRGDDASAVGAVEAGARFVLPFVRLYQARTGGENRRKCEEQAAHRGSVSFRDETGGNANGPSKCEAQEPLVWFDSLDGSESGMNDHGVYLATHQSAKETANQRGMRETVAVTERGR